MTRALLALAIASTLAIALGAGLLALPAGLIVGGLEGLAGVYVAAYLTARGGRR